MPRLQRLELLGFKSFAERIRLEFDTTITAIVGPNGSGKSNVADAVRWVLGEQNPRVLRGRRMEELVFGGSQSRRALGMAEVSLTLDNSDQSLPLDFTEVMIVRRLYRSGESEYSLCGQPCLQRDITSLLLDSGIGQRGITVIDQTRLEQILAPDGEERRILLEDVAGVSRYRARKRSALRKLEETRDRMSRLSDIVFELESRRGPLADQAEQAIRFNELRDERRRVEFCLVSVGLERLETACTQEKERAVRLQVQVQECVARLAESDDLRTDLASELTDEEEGLRRARRDLEAASERWRKAREKIAADEAAARELAAALERARDEARQVASEALGFDKPEGEDDRKHEQELERILADAAAHRASRQECLAALDRLREQVGKRTRDEQRLRESAAGLASRQEALSRRRERLAEDLARVDAQRRDLVSESDRLSRERTSLRQGLKAAVERCEQLARDLAAAGDQREQLARVHSELAAAVAGLEAERRAWAEALGDQGDEVSPHALANHLDVPDEFAAAVDAALGGLVEGMWVDGDDQCRELLADLRRRGLRRTVWLADLSGEDGPDPACLRGTGARTLADVCRSRGDSRLRSVLGRFIVADGLSLALRVRQATQGRFGVVTYDGTLVGVDGGITGGVPPATHRVQDVRKRKLDERISSMRDTLSLVTSDLSVSQDAYAQLEREQRTEAARVSALETEIGGRERQLASFEALNERLGDEGTRLVEEAGELDGELVRTASRREQVSGELAEASATASQHRAGLSDQQKQLADGDAKLRALERRAADLRVAEATRHERRQAREARQSELNRRLVEAEAGVSRLADQLRTRETSVETGREVVDRLAGEVQSRRETSTILETNVDRLRQRARDEQAAEAELRRRLHGLEGWLRRAETELARLEVQRDQMLERRSRLADQSESESGAEVDLEQLSARLVEIDRAVEAMGPINPLAVSEHRDLESRYRFLCEQRDDLVAGSESLERAVRRLDGEMKQLFLLTLEQVSSEYREVFRDMFGGGTAVVELADGGDDPLLATVDLAVQLPGRRMTGLPLLSGGERALCAIAFVFALLRVRPSPFCVLDEVDAPLDEVNTARFAGFLRQYSVGTQFVAITHQKQTMEVAQALYGVTMAEHGVSRVLSVRLEDIDRRAMA